MHMTAPHPNKKFKHPTRLSPTKMNPLYMAYIGMHERCRPSYKYAHRYFERGIHVCAEWAKPNWDVFADWALEAGWQEGLELDRKDNNTGYSPSNCRWATRTEQMRNSRLCVVNDDQVLESIRDLYFNKRLTQASIAKMLGVSQCLISIKLRTYLGRKSSRRSRNYNHL